MVESVEFTRDERVDELVRRVMLMKKNDDGASIVAHAGQLPLVNPPAYVDQETIPFNQMTINQVQSLFNCLNEDFRCC